MTDFEQKCHEVMVASPPREREMLTHSFLIKLVILTAALFAARRTHALAGRIGGADKFMDPVPQNLRLRMTSNRYCPKISGNPFLLLPITTTFVFPLLARFSVASIPFHSSSEGVIPWATIC